MENFIEETSSLKQSEKNRKKYFIYTLVSYASLVVAILSLFFAPIFIKVKDDKITIVASGAGLVVNIATLVLTFGLFKKEKQSIRRIRLCFYGRKARGVGNIQRD